MCLQERVPILTTPSTKIGEQVAISKNRPFATGPLRTGTCLTITTSSLLLSQGTGARRRGSMYSSDDDDRQPEQEEGGLNEYDAMIKHDYSLEYTMVKARNRHHSLHARRRSEHQRPFQEIQNHFFFLPPRILNTKSAQFLSSYKPPKACSKQISHPAIPFSFCGCHQYLSPSHPLHPFTMSAAQALQRKFETESAAYQTIQKGK